jgi:hypothetical protein
MNQRQKIKSLIGWNDKTIHQKRAILKFSLPKLRLLAKACGLLGIGMKVLAVLSLTDKFGDHNYIEQYAHHFKKFRRKPIVLLEIGVGGYAHDKGGRSLTLWESYFSKAKIVGLDIEDKCDLSRGRVKVYQGSQIDKKILREIVNDYGEFDIIIDDGSHLNSHQISTFEILFPHLRKGGIYVVEDLQTSYWDKYGGGNPGSRQHATSAMRYFSQLADLVNSEFFPTNRKIYGKLVGIESIHFYRELCIMHK